MISKKLYLLTIFTPALIFAASPQRVLPQSSGFWYTDATPNPTTCNTMNFSYTNKGTLADVENELYSQLPVENCTWQKPIILPLSGQMPPDFPGDENDLQALNVQVYDWAAYCKPNEGGLPDVKTFTIYPSYSCPPSSSYASLETDQGCYTSTKVTCSADVLGRDLNTSITPLQGLGHVGLSLGETLCPSDQTECMEPDASPLTSAVAEVLTEVDPSRQSVVHMDSVTSFINATPHFWGDKYDLPNHQVTNNDFGNILFALVPQYNLPSEYTYFWGYAPAGIFLEYSVDPTSGNVTTLLTLFPGKFRCDSFVYYCYEAAGLKIPYSGIRTPSSIYDAFINQRAISNTLTSIPQESHTAISDDDLETQIKEVFAAEPFDLGQADNLTNQYDSDTTIDRQEKINFLWGLATSYQSDSFKFNYLLDVLGYLKPYELAPNLIALYGSTQDQDVKNTLITVLAYTSYFSTTQDVQALSAQDKQNVISIINFLKTTALTENNTQRAASALVNVIPVLNYNQAISLLSQFTQEKPSALSNQTYAQQAISIALSNQENQSESLSQALKQNNPDLALAACQISTMYPIGAIQPTSKQLLSSLLLKNQAQLLNRSPSILNLSGCYWPSVYATLQTDDLNQRLEIIESLVLGQNNLENTVNMINSIKPSDLQAMPKNDLLQIKEHLTKLEAKGQSSLNQQQTAGENEKLTFLNAALSRQN